MRFRRSGAGQLIRRFGVRRRPAFFGRVPIAAAFILTLRPSRDWDDFRVRAVGFFEFGGPEVLQVVDLPEPHAGPGEVRIRVRAATVNPIDTLARAGKRRDAMAELSPPYVVGMEAAGEIDEVGAGAPWPVGEHVIALVLPFGPHKGAHAEQVVVPAAQVVRAPAGMGPVEAATIPMNGMTAALVIEALDLPPGATIAVTGAAGAVGGYVIQLAKAAGLQVIADASEKDRGLVRDLGADEIVPRGADVARHIRALAPDGVAGLVDASVQHAQVVPAIADGGVLVLVRDWAGEPGRGIRKRHVLVSQAAGRQDLLVAVRDRAEQGVLVPRVARTFSPEEAAVAHRMLKAGGTRGRLVITF